jgi:hypothetical protein
MSLKWEFTHYKYERPTANKLPVVSEHLVMPIKDNPSEAVNKRPFSDILKNATKSDFHDTNQKVARTVVVTVKTKNNTSTSASDKDRSKSTARSLKHRKTERATDRSSVESGHVAISLTEIVEMEINNHDDLLKNADDIISRGKKLLETLGDEFLITHHGKFFSVNVCTGEYFIGEDVFDVSDEILRRYGKNAPVWNSTIGIPIHGGNAHRFLQPTQ